MTFSPTRVSVPSQCIDACSLHFREMGRDGFEGIALLVGDRSCDSWEVTETVIPAQRAIRSDAGASIWVDEDELHRLNIWLSNHRVQVIAQIHSHPTRAYHSTTDVDYVIAVTEMSFSIVVPDFAALDIQLDACAVFQLRDARWRRINPNVVHRVFVVA